MGEIYFQRMPIKDLYDLVHSMKYTTPIRCNKCGERLGPSDEVWREVNSRNEEAFDPAYFHYSCLDGEL